MIPMIMKIKVPRKTKPALTLYLPLFLAWLLVFAAFVLLLPIFLVAALCTWSQGYGKIILFFIPMVFSLLWHMHGLVVDVEGPDGTIYMSFI